MRSNAVLIMFRLVAVLLMLFGVLNAVAVIFAIFTQGEFQQLFDAPAGNQWLGLLLVWPSQFCMTPILTFAAGAILFVQVEIALRSGPPPRDDA